MKSAVLSIAALLAIATSANAAVLVTNGTFEAGSLTGWAPSGDAYIDSSNPHSGTYNATFSDPGSLTQNIATTIGHKYQLDYWFTRGLGSGTILVKWDGIDIPGSQVTPPNSYTQYTFEVTATSSSTPLYIYYGGLGASLDDISLTDLGPVPEPASLSLLALGTLTLLRRKRTCS